MEEYLNKKHVLWLDFRTIDENALHGQVGRKIENALEEVTQQIDKKAETNSWNTHCLHITNYGCSIEHSEWSVCFYHILRKC